MRSDRFPALWCLAALATSTAPAPGWPEWQGAGTNGITATDPGDPATQWGNPANWSGGAPDPGELVYFTFANAGRVYVATADVGGIHVEGTTAEAFLQIDGAAPLVVTDRVHIGSNSIGKVVQTGGSDVRLPFIHLGETEGGQGTYEVRSGSLTVDRWIMLGKDGIATFLQEEGTTELGGWLVLDNEYDARARVELHGGRLEVGTTDPDENDLILKGYPDGPTFLQTGGEHVVHGDVEISPEGQSAEYLQTGGSLSVGGLLVLGPGPDARFEMGGQAVSSQQTLIGEGRPAQFVHTAGVHTTGYLGLAMGHHSPALEGEAVYELSGGGVSAGGESIGLQGPATLTQSGGEHTIAGELQIGFAASSTGTLNLSGGSLTVGILRLGGFSGPGTLRITSPAAFVEVRDALVLGAKGTFAAAPGTVIHMVGASLENHLTNRARAEGLRSAEMIFEGGGTALTALEVGGEDLGAVAAGFDYNFDLHALTVGGAEVGRVRLVDEADNQPNFDGAEALYVRSLTVGPGSHLHLNGLNLYYQSCDIDPAATIHLDGGQMAWVPEPACAAMLAVGAGLCLRRRRHAGRVRRTGSRRGRNMPWQEHW